MEWLQSLMPFVAVVLLAVLAWYILPWIKAKVGSEEFDRLWNLICIAVQAAEQMLPAPGSGVKKLANVLEFLASQGIDVQDAKVRPMIEAAVKELT